MHGHGNSAPCAKAVADRIGESVFHVHLKNQGEHMSRIHVCWDGCCRKSVGALHPAAGDGNPNQSTGCSHQSLPLKISHYVWRHPTKLPQPKSV